MYPIRQALQLVGNLKAIGFSLSLSPFRTTSFLIELVPIQDAITQEIEVVTNVYQAS